jgi:cellulose biosynthesis protein BcsQ
MSVLKVRRESDGSLVTLRKELHTGGEGTIYSLRDDDTHVVKIYKDISMERAVKLITMLLNLPTDPAHEPEHVSFAWPSERMLDEYGTCLGFLMPYIEPSHHSPLSKLINPKARRKLARGITWEFLLRTATNLASVVGALHERGYVIGDLNENNVLVSNTALVTLVDCDSMQVPTVSGATFYCTVGSSEYTPAELQHADFADVKRQPYHDAFGLAVLIFQLLMEGQHPFQGKWLGPGEPPSIEARIAVGDWPYESTAHSTPATNALPLTMLPPSLQQLMWACFVDGHRSPEQRPSAEQWHAALQSTENTLITCTVNDRHRYNNHLDRCPWCERTSVGIPDPYPPLAQPESISSSKRMGRYAHVVAIHGCKGQGGTSTTTMNLAVRLAELVLKTLVADFDPQSDTTTGLGLDAHKVDLSIYELLVDENVSVAQVIKPEIRPNLSLLPAKVDLYAADTKLAHLDQRETRLKRALDTVKQDYDFILIDCRTWPGLFTANAYSAADGVILVLRCEYFALQGMEYRLNTIQSIRDRWNPHLTLDGVLLTMYDPRDTTSSMVLREISEHFPKEKFDTIIPRNVRLAEVPSFKIDILEQDPRSPSALAYKRLAEEVIARTKLMRETPA